MIYTELTMQAMVLCFAAHKDQSDKSGIPYVFHPIHLAEQMPDEYTTVTALLHDVVEDTEYTLDDLRGMGYPDAVMSALALLTHKKSTPYPEYVAAIKENPIARTVKLADLRHNSDLTRLRVVDDAALARVAKYREAMAILEAVEEEKALTDVSASTLEKTLRDLYSFFGIAPGAELTRKVSLAVEYLRKDRERYIEICESGTSVELHRSGDGGVIGKTVPIAQRVQVSTVRRQHRTEAVTKISEVELLVSGDAVKPIIRSYEIGRNAKQEKLLWFTRRPYTDLVPGDLEGGYEAKDPEQIRPIADHVERAIQAALMDVFPRFVSNDNPDCIRDKVECAILAIRLSDSVKIRQHGDPVWGKRLFLARALNSRFEEHPDYQVSSTRSLLLFVTDTGYQFLLQTSKTYTYYHRIQISDDFPDDYILEPSGTRCRRSYRPISPDEIGEGYISCI